MLTLAKPGKIWLALTLSLLAAAVTHSAESAALCCSLGVQISKKRGFPALQCGDSSGHWHQAVFGASLERLFSRLAGSPGDLAADTGKVQ